jgi:Retrotransposon gag protein/Zinc knuckle
MESQYSPNNDAFEFITQLEIKLSSSPISADSWCYVLQQMIQDQHPIVSQWVYQHIIVPHLSWNAAKELFLSQYQRADLLHQWKMMYDQCRQGEDESIQSYSSRFTGLMDRLHFKDNDVQSIAHYVRGLTSNLFKKLVEHRALIRITKKIPQWDFSSLSDTVSMTVQLAIQEATIYEQCHPQDASSFIQQSAFANPVTATLRNKNVRSPATAADSARAVRFSHFNANRVKAAATSQPARSVTKPEPTNKNITKSCIYHPNSTSHSTQECIRKNQGASSHSTTAHSSTSTNRNRMGGTNGQKRRHQDISSTSSKISSRPHPTTSTSLTTQTSSRQPQSQSRTADLSSIQCYRCKKMGHYATSCTEPQTQLERVPISGPNVHPARQTQFSRAAQRRHDRRARGSSSTKAESHGNSSHSSSTPSQHQA